MDFALVTVTVPRYQWQGDMELPVRMKIADLIEKIIYTLKNYDGERFGTLTDLELRWEETSLNRDLTLADYRIWDGNTIEART